MTRSVDGTPLKSGKGDSFDSDVRLARAVSEGSIPAWHAFIHQYSGLIYSVVRRHLLTDDVDEIRSAYVDVLKALYDGELAKYRGESRLSTWLIVTTRSRAVDLARKSHGRRRLPLGYDRLGEFDRRVLRLFYVDGLPLEIIVQILGWRQRPPTVDEIVDSIERIERTIDPRYLQRLDEERIAKRRCAGSVQTLRYLLRREQELEERSDEAGADRTMIEAELLETASRLRDALAALSPQERRIVVLRFRRGWPAGKIAERLGLKGPRQVYGLIDKVIRRLRDTFSSKEH